MAAIAGDLSRKILGHSDAAKAFRPWWDTLEENLLYTFVVMGKKMFISKLRLRVTFLRKEQQD